MDREMAGAVLQRWNDGLPVFEGALYKAAAVCGIDPEAALTEARYYTVLDQYLLEKQATGRPMNEAELIVFSLAAGYEPESMVKTAADYGLDGDELVLRSLYMRDWAPDLEKLALLAPAQGPQEGPPQDDTGMQPAPGAGPPGAEQGAMPPQPGAQVQQDPGARAGYKPSPTGPEQVPPSPDGNMNELMQMAGSAQGAEMGGGQPPTGMGAEQPPPPPPSPEEKIQQTAPDLPPENVQRYAQALTQLEQQIGFQVTDPKQVQKFVQQQQKSDGKIVDQAMKDMDAQATTQQTTQFSSKPAPPKPQPAPAPPAAQPTQGNLPEGKDGAEKVAATARILAHIFAE